MCECSCQNDEQCKIDKLIDMRLNKKLTTIELLQQVQDIIGYLSPSTLEYICKNAKLKESEVYGIVTFYSQFTMTPKAKYNIEICMGTACYVKGSDKILQKIKNILKTDENEVTKDGKFCYKIARCLGCCSIAPAVKINDQFYANVDENKIEKILKEFD